MALKDLYRRGGFDFPSPTRLLIINCGADENSLSDQDVYTPVGDLAFDLFNFLLSRARRRIDAHVAVLVLETLQSRFDPGAGTQLLRQQAKLGEIFVDEDPSF